MPTYTNDSTETKIVEDINGVLQHVAPLGSIATYKILGTGWTKTSDSPLYTEIVTPFPTDYHGAQIPLPTTPTTILVFTSSGSFQEIVIPFAIKSVLIQIHNGDTGDFSSYSSNPPVFHFSTTGHPTNRDYINCVGSLQMDIVTPANRRLGYVRATEGQYVTVLGVA